MTLSQKIRNAYSRRILPAALWALITLGSAQANAQEQSPVEEKAGQATEEAAESILRFGYNALETAITNKEDLKVKLFTDISTALGGFEMGYWGLNTVTSDTNGYFGRHDVYFGRRNAGTKGVFIFKTNNDGVIDSEFGIRNTSLSQKLGGYGYLVLSADKSSASTHFFYGRQFGSVSLETLQIVSAPFNGGKNWYQEFQINKNLGDKFALFGRAEIPDSNPTLYMAGFKAMF